MLNGIADEIGEEGVGVCGLDGWIRARRGREIVKEEKHTVSCIRVKYILCRSFSQQSCGLTLHLNV